jgi:hypothetical protein
LSAALAGSFEKVEEQVMDPYVRPAWMHPPIYNDPAPPQASSVDGTPVKASVEHTQDDVEEMIKRSPREVNYNLPPEDPADAAAYERARNSKPRDTEFGVDADERGDQ